MSENEIDVKIPDKRMIDDYFGYQEYYSKIYGDKTIVCMQNGKFYELYNTEFEGYDLRKIQEILQVRFARKGKNTNKTDPRSKPNMLGFPTINLYNSLNLLTRSGYTVVLFDEDHTARSDPKNKTKSKAKFERQLTGIYSPGTHISDKQIDSNYILTVYIVSEPQLKSKNSPQNLLAIGTTLLDITTGDSIVYEFYSDKNDENFGLDELLRIIQGFRPTETVIYFKPDNYATLNNIIDNIKVYLELDNIIHYFYVYYGSTNIDIDKSVLDPMKLLIPDMFKINYQNDYLATIFNLNSQINLNRKTSPIELLSLENKPYMLISLMVMLRYVNEHNKNLLKNLSYPELYSYNKHLILGNNAIQQLNVIDSNNLESYNKKIESLFDVVNKTATPMGRRFLRKNLANPLSREEKKIINKRYDIIDELISSKKSEKIHVELKNIYDLERYHRKMARGKLNPYDFYRMDYYYASTIKIINMIKKYPIISRMLPSSIISEFIEYRDAYSKIYNIEIMQKYNNFSDISESIFNVGYNTKIDKNVNKIKYGTTILELVKQLLSDMIVEKKQSNNEKVKLESGDTNYWFTVTKTHEKSIREHIDNLKGSHIYVDMDIGERLQIKISDIEFKTTKGRTKIIISSLDTYVSDLDESMERLKKLTELKFVSSILKLYEDHHQMLIKISNFIAEIDFLTSGAIVADEYFYCRPIIESVVKETDNSFSYIKTKQLRHPIIERLCKETSYVPNDIELGNVPITDNVDKKSNIDDSLLKTTANNGILLFGVNSCGKSSFMKSIGLAIILAQIGYYVPAEEFVYEPYMAIYARITGNDNLFKGLSSFVVEMTELDSILKRIASNGKNTLVIGDEVCRGTNDTDAQSLVASALVRLSEANSTFIFSSHLHNLPTIPEIIALKNLRLYHLLVEYDPDADCLIFDRRLVHGSGPHSYALIVAKYIIKDKRFINLAETIKQRLTGELVNIPIKKSRFNKLLLAKMCAICFYVPILSYHKELETHHIQFQSKCLPDGKIIDQKHLSKDELYNLVILCRHCHENVHRKNIEIYGYIDTSVGPILDYEINIQSKIDNDFKRIENIDKKCCNKSHI